MKWALWLLAALGISLFFQFRLSQCPEPRSECPVLSSPPPQPSALQPSVWEFDTPGFSFRQSVRESFAAFVAQAAKTQIDLHHYFYDPRPALDLSDIRKFEENLKRNFFFRLPGCEGVDLDPLPPTMAEQEQRIKEAAVLWADRAPKELCLFSQMRPSKLLSVLTLARRLNVTHMIESGRKGGMSAFNYAVQGLKVTSVEAYPVPHISASLRQLAPGIDLRDGDGTKLVLQVVQEIRAADPTARIAVVLDGPKYESAYKVFQTVRKEVIFSVFDDTYPGSNFRDFLDAEELGVFFTDAAAWMKSGFPDKDMARLEEGWPQDNIDPATQFAESWQVLGILPGDRWDQWK